VVPPVEHRGYAAVRWGAALGSKRVLVTGASGFIGFHLCKRLLEEGNIVLGIDNFDPYYDVALKRRRAKLLLEHAQFSLAEETIEDVGALIKTWGSFRPELVIHLAAQAGVRDSGGLARAYLGANLVGSFNILEAARAHPVKHLLIASTSSVYGADGTRPFTETQPARHPISIYAATKKSVELLAHSYSHLFRTPVTAFRFFTVYGPWGRPDMALFKFTRAILEGRAIDIYDAENMARDFTYVDDLVEAISRLIPIVPGDERVAGDSLSHVAPFRVVNIAGGKCERLVLCIEELEEALGMKAVKNFLPAQPGEVLTTEASPELLRTLTGYVPSTPLREGIRRFVQWYREHQI